MVTPVFASVKLAPEQEFTGALQGFPLPPDSSTTQCDPRPFVPQARQIRRSQVHVGIARAN